VKNAKQILYTFLPVSKIEMSKLNIFALFGIVFLSSVLLGSGTFVSNPVFAQENEAEVEADIEQENKCKDDTECENENEINNSLTITTITQSQEQEQPETPTCETCFTDILSEEEISSFLIAFDEVQLVITTLEELCEFIDRAQGIEQLNQDLLTVAQASISEEQYNALIECLQDAGLDVDFPSD